MKGCFKVAKRRRGRRQQAGLLSSPANKHASDHTTSTPLIVTSNPRMTLVSATRLSSPAPTQQPSSHHLPSILTALLNIIYIFTHTEAEERQTLRQDGSAAAAPCFSQDCSSAAAPCLFPCGRMLLSRLKPTLPLLWRLNRASDRRIRIRIWPIRM